MYLRAVSTFIAIVAALAAPGASALGFGRVVNGTQLGQPLNFAAVLNLDGDETLARECVSAEVFFGDNKLQPGQIRVTLEGGGRRERSVRITSTALIDEPVLTVSITLGCSSKVTRRFVSFIDPPTVNLARSGPGADSLTRAPQRVDSQLAPLLAIVQAARPATPRLANPSANGGARKVAAPRQVAERQQERSRKPAPPRVATVAAVAAVAAVVPRPDRKSVV